MNRSNKRQSMKKWNHSRPKNGSDARENERRIKGQACPRRKQWKVEGASGD